MFVFSSFFPLTAQPSFHSRTYSNRDTLSTFSMFSIPKMAFVFLITSAFLSHFAVSAAHLKSNSTARLFKNSTADYQSCYDGPYGVTGIITVVLLMMKTFYCIHFEQPTRFNYRRFLPEFVAIVLMIASSVTTFARCTNLWEIDGAFGQLALPFFLLAVQVLKLSQSAWIFNICSLFFLLASVMQLIVLSVELSVSQWITTKTSIIMLVAYLVFAVIVSIVGTVISKKHYSQAAAIHIFLTIIAPSLTVLQYVGFSYALKDAWGISWTYLIGTVIWCILLPNRVKPGQIDSDRLYYFYIDYTLFAF